jgi:flavodoxin
MALLIDGHARNQLTMRRREFKMSRKLVAYFSASGVTRNVAKTLAEAADADLYEIKPEVPYTQADLDWQDKNARSTIEMNDTSFRPAIADNNAHVEDYDVVFVGFPIWWYIAPTIINAFLASYDFSGKTIILFATSGGSGFGKTVEKLKDNVHVSTAIKEGNIFNGRPTKADLSAWINSLGI